MILGYNWLHWYNITGLFWVVRRPSMVSNVCLGQCRAHARRLGTACTHTRTPAGRQNSPWFFSCAGCPFRPIWTSFLLPIKLNKQFLKVGRLALKVAGIRWPVTARIVLGFAFGDSQSGCCCMLGCLERSKSSVIIAAFRYYSCCFPCGRCLVNTICWLWGEFGKVWVYFKMTTKTTFRAPSGICTDCGSILPLVQRTGNICCYTCKKEYPVDGKCYFKVILYLNEY